MGMIQSKNQPVLAVKPFVKMAVVFFLQVWHSSASADATTLLVEAEHTDIAGRAAIYGSGGASGRAVTFMEGRMTWDVICPAGSYRLFSRVRAGWDGDRDGGVSGQVHYAAHVDSRPVEFRLVPETLVYFGDEANWGWLVADVGHLSQGWHQIQFTSTWTYAKADLFVLTSDSTYSPPTQPPFGSETTSDTSLLPDSQSKCQYAVFTCWNAEPAVNASPDARPTSDEITTTATSLACVNEYEPVCFNVTNWTDSPIVLRVARQKPSHDRVPGGLPSDGIRILTPVPLPSWTGAALADAMPDLPSSGLLEIPGGETRQLWFEINTHDATPGTYDATFVVERVRAPARAAATTLTIKVTVVPIVLPQEHPLAVYTNEYDNDQDGRYQDMTSHYVNTYEICSVPHPAAEHPDYTAMDRWIKMERELGRARVIVFEHWHFREDKSWRQPAYRELWIQGIRKWATHLREDLHLTYDDYVLHTYDEQSGPGDEVQEYLEARQLVREADPNIRELITCGLGTELEEVKQMTEPNAVWSPYMSYVTDEDKEVLAFMQESGCPIWPYECGEDKRGWDPQARYRTWPWVLHSCGGDGLFLWTYMGSEAWKGYSWDGGVTYPGNGCVVTSRRWELLRDGLEDYLLLQVASEAGKQTLVNEAVTAVTRERDNRSLLRHYREKIIEALIGK